MTMISLTRISTLGAIITLATLSVAASSLALAQSNNALPAEKQAIQQQYDQERVAGAKDAAAHDPNAPYPIVQESPFLRGIIKDCDAPISSENADIISCWQDILQGVETQVYTGSESQDNGDPQQGVIYVITAPDGNGVRILTPIKVGALRIKKANKDVLTLVSVTGCYQWRFIVSTRQLNPENCRDDHDHNHDRDRDSR